MCFPSPAVLIFLQKTPRGRCLKGSWLTATLFLTHKSLRHQLSCLDLKIYITSLEKKIGLFGMLLRQPEIEWNLIWLSNPHWLAQCNWLSPPLHLTRHKINKTVLFFYLNYLISLLKKMTRLWIRSCHFFLNYLEFITISSNLTAYSFLSSSKVCSSRKLSVAEGDFRRVDTLAFFPLSIKKTKQNKKQNNEKEKNYPIAIILQNNHLCKRPLSVI